MGWADLQLHQIDSCQETPISNIQTCNGHRGILDATGAVIHAKAASNYRRLCNIDKGNSNARRSMQFKIN
jgi:hypothetical protein